MNVHTHVGAAHLPVYLCSIVGILNVDKIISCALKKLLYQLHNDE